MTVASIRCTYSNSPPHCRRRAAAPVFLRLGSGRARQGTLARRICRGRGRRDNLPVRPVRAALPAALRLVGVAGDNPRLRHRRCGWPSTSSRKRCGTATARNVRAMALSSRTPRRLCLSYRMAMKGQNPPMPNSGSADACLASTATSLRLRRYRTIDLVTSASVNRTSAMSGRCQERGDAKWGMEAWCMTTPQPRMTQTCDATSAS